MARGLPSAAADSRADWLPRRTARRTATKSPWFLVASRRARSGPAGKPRPSSPPRGGESARGPPTCWGERSTSCARIDASIGWSATMHHRLERPSRPVADGRQGIGAVRGMRARSSGSAHVVIDGVARPGRLRVPLRLTCQPSLGIDQARSPRHRCHPRIQLIRCLRTSAAGVGRPGLLEQPEHGQEVHDDVEAGRPARGELTERHRPRRGSSTHKVSHGDNDHADADQGDVEQADDRGE